MLGLAQGWGVVASRAVDDPWISSARGAWPHTGLCPAQAPAVCAGLVLSSCKGETRGDHKTFGLNTGQSQLRALSLPTDSLSGLKLPVEFRPLRFGSFQVEGFGWGCHSIKRLHEQCSAAPRPLQCVAGYFFPLCFGFLPVSGCPAYHYW